MAGVIQYGALRLDVMVDTKGVRALRTDMAALTRVLNDAKGPAGSFERNITRLTVAQQEGKISAQQQKEILDAIIQRYLKSAKTTAEYMAALAHVKQVLPGMSTEVSRLALAHRREQRETEASAKAAEEAAIRKRRAAQYNKRLIADAVAEAEKAERQAERAARKAAREAEARRQENKRVRDSVMQMAAGHNRATQQIIADLNLLENARRKGRIATFHIVEAEKNQLEAYLRGQRGPRQLAAAVQSLTALYPQHAATIQMILTKLQQEAAAEKATADAKRAAVRAKKDADAQQKADMAAMTALNVKARGEAGKLLSQLEALARIQKSGAASQQSINSAMKQAARDYFANAKSVKDLVDMKQKLNNLTKEEMQAVRAAMSVRAKEITDLERTTTANRNAAKEKRENERAQKFLNQVIREGMSPTEQIAAKEQRLNQLLAQGRINAQQYSQALASLKSQMQNLNKETSLATQLFTRFLSLAFAKELGQRALAFRNDSINAFMDLRDSIIKLEVILGDAAEASKLYQQLRQIAVQSNQTSDAVIRSAVTMAQFGVSASNLAPAMERITQIAAGNAERLQSLSLAYAQVAAAGRLTGQETLQFVNAGFSPLAEIARTTGKDMRTLRKEMEEGLITFDMVTESLITATSEGGRFAGMNLKLSKELSGSMSRYNDGFKRLQESIGALSEMRAIIDLLAESFKSLAEKLDQFNQGADAFFRNRTMTAIDFLREQERIDKLPFAFRDSIEQRNRQIGRGFFGQDVDRFTQQELDAAREDLRREREKSRTAGGQAFGIGSLAERDARTPAAMERERLRVEQERIAEMREKITQLLTDVQEGATTDLDRFFELRAKLDFAVSDGIIGIAESQRILAEASAPLIGLREQELTQMERARAEYDRMLAFYQAGAISLDQFNAHYLAFKDELNKPFLDKAKEVREALKTPAERDAEQVRELAALINAGMVTQQEATKFLAQQAQENIKAIQTDLPQGVSFGTREAYELMNRVNNQIQTGQLQVARQQLIEQKKAADLLKEIAAKPDIGIVN
jgi:tape measure domain-containing protein